MYPEIKTQRLSIARRMQHQAFSGLRHNVKVICIGLVRPNVEVTGGQ